MSQGSKLALFGHDREGVLHSSLQNPAGTFVQINGNRIFHLDIGMELNVT
jgi:hypothetical protein